MRTGHDDGRTRLLAAHAGGVSIGVAHLDNEHLQALVMAIMLIRGTLVALTLRTLGIVMRQLGLNAVTNLDDSEI